MTFVSNVVVIISVFCEREVNLPSFVKLEIRLLLVYYKIMVIK